MIKNITFIILIAMLFASCEDLFVPAIENNRGIDGMEDDAGFAQGILLNGYTRIPTNGWSFNDVATDDAVSNDQTSSLLKMATGQWAANFNPVEQWNNAFAAIQYLNIYLSRDEKVTYAEDAEVDLMFKDRLRGEALGLRGLFMFYLLQSHAGWTADGKLLGVPIVIEPQTTQSDFNQPRATFEECMNQLYADFTEAEELLPLDYEDLSNASEMHSKYADLGIAVEKYNRVFGFYSRQRLSARIVKALRAKAALLASSPAYNEGNTTTWADAANYAAEVLNLIGGVAGLAENGHTWYTNISEIENIGGGINPQEILWRGNVGTNGDLEKDNYPPSLYGSGRINPTQNLVDAFPTVDGYPIAEDPNYISTTPYVNRDPRLSQYIVVNGSTCGPNSSVVTTASDGTTNDALNKVETSTRTGYYMRKLLRQDVNLDPVITNYQKHYKPLIRYTELFLVYAEAANEAWGPMSDGGIGYSAYDVIKAIRKRAGVGLNNSDEYLESVKNDQDIMRKLIHNERRLELCFEGFRFWDLRRRNENLSETAYGVNIVGSSYQSISVENRIYKDYMNHGPIPYGEVLKWGNLEQNAGW